MRFLCLCYHVRRAVPAVWVPEKIDISGVELLSSKLSWTCSLTQSCSFELSLDQPITVNLPTHECEDMGSFFGYSFLKKYIHLFIFGCDGSLLLCAGFLSLRPVRATLHCGVRASCCHGFTS